MPPRFNILVVNFMLLNVFFSSFIISFEFNVVTILSIIMGITLGESTLSDIMFNFMLFMLLCRIATDKSKK